MRCWAESVTGQRYDFGGEQPHLFAGFLLEHHGACQLQCVSLTEHHGTEDAAIFPHLRSSQDSLRKVLDQLDSEHHAIHDVLEEIDAALAR